jgi:cytochrome c oxidase assembly protein subunit 15
MLPSPAPGYSRALNWFGWFSAVATLGLICIGGLVTSHGAGLAVPDWPNTYGYNMFFFPVSKWVGGILYEHTHRLAASGVGLLTTVLAVWLWRRESRRWVRWLGVAAFFGVVVQGVLGGLRVTLLKDELGIVHATLAQLFLVLVAGIGLVTTRTWLRGVGTPSPSRGLVNGLCLACGLVLAQLVLGAAMRHQHAGLAIPDFPLAYGRWWPATEADAIAFYNQSRVEVRALNPITAGQIILHLAHRIGALLILLTVAGCVWRAWRELGFRRPFVRACVVWLGLVLAQITLGAVTVWSNKSADLTTAHVAVGATTLVVGSLLALWAVRASFCVTRSQQSPSAPPRPPRAARVRPRHESLRTCLF